MNKELAVVSDKATLKDLLSLESVQQSLRDVLPKHLTPERVMKMTLVAASRQPKLFECTTESILKSVMTSAELGLDCSGTLGAGYLVPYYNNKIKAMEAVFIPGYQGLIELARRSGQVRAISSRIVYKDDVDKGAFTLDYGDVSNPIVHKPYFGADRKTDKEDIHVVYAMAELAGGVKQIEVMDLAQIEKVRGMSKAGAAKGGPWDKHFGEMARKTVLRRLCKYLPKSPELEMALTADAEQFDFNNRPELKAQTGRGFGFPQTALPKPEEEEEPEPVIAKGEPVDEFGQDLDDKAEGQTGADFILHGETEGGVK